MKQVRSGITLVEMLVVISICFLVSAASGVLLHGMYRADMESRSAIESHTTMASLSLQFRRDAHTAAAAEPLTDAKGKTVGLVLQKPGNPTIEYREQGRTIVRTAKQSDKVLHMDSFCRPAGMELVWTVEQGQPPMAAIRFALTAHRGVKADAIPRQQIESAVGILHEGRGER